MVCLSFLSCFWPILEFIGFLDSEGRKKNEKGCRQSSTRTTIPRMSCALVPMDST